MKILYTLINPPSYQSQANEIIAMMDSIGAKRVHFVYSHQALWAPNRSLTGNYTDPWINFTGNPGNPGLANVLNIDPSQSGIEDVQNRGLYELIAYVGNSTNGVAGWLNEITGPNIELWRQSQVSEGRTEFADPDNYDGHLAFDEETFICYSADFGSTHFSQWTTYNSLSEANARVLWERTMVAFYCGAIKLWREKFPKATFSFPYLINQQTYNLDLANASAGGQVLSSSPSSTGRTRRAEIEFQTGASKTNSEIDYIAAKGSTFGWMGQIISALDYIDTEMYAHIGYSTTGTVGTHQVRVGDAKYYYNLHADFIKKLKDKYRKPYLGWLASRYPSGVSTYANTGLNKLDAEALVSATVRAGGIPCIWINCGVGGTSDEADQAVIGVSNILPYLKLAKKGLVV